MMVTFLCPLDWVTKCPEIWLKSVTLVSVRVFVDK